MRWKSISWKLLVLIVVGAILVVWLMKAPMISWYLTEKLNVPTSVRSVSIWPSDATIQDFRIKNPSGFKMNSAFEAGQIQISYRWPKLRASISEIDRVVLDNVYLGIECSNPTCSKNNWTAIGGRLAKEQAKEKNRQVVIHTLILQNIKVEVRGLGVGKPPIYKEIDYLEFNEVGSEKGFPTDKLIRAIFQGAGVQEFLENFLNPQEAIKQFFPGIFGHAE